MPTRPPSPDPTGSSNAGSASPFAGLGAGLGAGLDFFQDWFKAAGSALPNMQGAQGAGGMSAWTMPTLDPAELDKRIQDLKTVQFWLEQNARMISMTIQGLEVQRMTLSTLKGMNVSMDALRDSLKAKPEASQAAAPAAPSPRPAPAPSWSASPRAEEGAASSDDDAPASSAKASATEPAASPDGNDLINPMRWWDTLTQQFTHLASQAAQQVGDSVGGSMDMLKQAQAATGGATATTSTASARGKAASAGPGAKAAASDTAAAGRGKKPAVAPRKTAAKTSRSSKPA